MATVAELAQAGFNEVEIEQHVVTERQRLATAGFSQEEINRHFDFELEPPTQAPGLRPATKRPEGFNFEQANADQAAADELFSFSDNSIQPFDPAEAPIQGDSFKAGAVERGAVQVARSLGITSLLPLREAGLAGGAAVPSPDELAQTAFLKKLPEIVGSTAVMVGKFAAAHGIFKAIGFMQELPKAAGVLSKAFETAKLFAGVEAIDQVAKKGFNEITGDDLPYEGAIGVMKSAAFGMIFSLAAQGTGKAGRALWSKLKPTEQAWALKQLKLTKKATPEEIKVAANKFILKFHPDKVKGFREDFDQVIKARDILRKGPAKDIVVARVKPKLLPGAVEPAAKQPIRPTPEAAVAREAAKVEPRGVITPTAAEEGLEIAKPPVREGKQPPAVAVTKPSPADKIAIETLKGKIARAKTDKSRQDLQARLDKLEGKPEPVKVEVTDQDLLTERREIKAIPQGKRTLKQLQRIDEIENELVKRNADEFPEIDISPKARNAEVKKVRDQVVSHPVYQAALEGLGDIPDLSGGFQVSKREFSDVKARFEGQPAKLRKFSVSETGGERWDSAAAEINIDTLDEFMDAVELFVESEVTKAGAINEVALAKALNSFDPSIELFALKKDMLRDGFTAAEINTEIAEFASREGIDLKNVSDELISLEEITDVQKKQAILRELDKTFKPTKKKRAIQPAEKAAIERAKVRAFKSKKPRFVVKKGETFLVRNAPPVRGEFIKVTPPSKDELTGKTERLFAGLTPEQEQEAKLLRQRIDIARKKIGLTQKAFSELKLKHTNFRTLTGKVAINKITVEQLSGLLKAVETARPVVIGFRTVITLKTENEIAELKDSLTELGFMNEAEFERILAFITTKGFGQKGLGVKQPKFIDAKNFITQEQGRNLLERMHDSAQRLRVTEPVRRAIERKPEIKAEIKKIEKLPTKAKDPSRLKSMRFVYQRMGEQASQPIYDVFLDLTLESQLRSRERHLAMKLAEALPDFAKIATNPDALQRIEDWIVSKSTLRDKPSLPTDITENEIRLAKLIQASFKSYETLARAGKMFEFFDSRTKIPQYLQFKKQIDKAFDIFNTKGYDALIRYLDTQDWGIVSAGYSPMESVVSKVSTHRMPDIAVGKARIKVRGITYRAQDRDILQRWYSYMRQMDQLVHIQPRIKSLVRLINDNQEFFVNPRKLNSAVSTYLDNLKHTNYEDGLVEEWSRRLYSQAITVRVLADPVKPGRNLLQNVSFSEDRRDFLRLLAKLARGEKLINAEDTKYLETYVQQSSVMMSDWAFVGEDPILFKNLTKWIQRKTLYPSSDRINRLISFAAKIDRVRRAFAKKQSLADKMKESRFSDMQKTEQRMALSILATDGVDEMARFVAKVHTDNTHFLYGREQRSPAEQTKFGRIALNLALFRRAALEKALFQLGKVFERGTGFQRKLRAANVLVTLLSMSALVGVLWKKTTGQKYSPYSYFSFLELNFGGLAVATIEKAEDAYNSMLSIITLDPKERGKAVDQFGRDLTKVADFMIPFYDIGLRAIEATIGSENIDRIPFKKMRELIDKEFRSRGLRQVDRSLVEKIQFTFARGRKTEAETGGRRARKARPRRQRRARRARR